MIMKQSYDNVAIKDEVGNVYLLGPTFLQEIDVYGKVDRIVLLQQIGVALKTKTQIDCLYARTGPNVLHVNHEVFRVQAFRGKQKATQISIGCRHFVGVNAEAIVKRAKAAVKEWK